MQRNGSATSSQPATSRQATLTSEASLTCERPTSPDTRKPTSLQALEDGRSPSVSPDGPTTDLFGQALVPASHSLPPERARRPMTSATCGLRGFLSSPSAALQSSLENRLRRRLDGDGSTLFALTWRAKATPAGRPYSQLVASALPTSDSDCGSWPTPMAGTPAQKGYNAAGSTDSSRKMVAWAPWPSPRANNHTGAGTRGQGGENLQTVAAWSTPRANKWGFPDAHGSQEKPLGPNVNGSTARTEKPGQLDPDHPCWLMGYQTEHLNCAPTETPSSLKSRRHSSERA
jgi:hypothetical protein